MHRFTRLLILSLSTALVLPPAPFAQQGPPPGFSNDATPGFDQRVDPGDDAFALDPADPPQRVGRVARLSGSAELRLPGEEGWLPARANEPLIAGQAVATGEDGRASLDFGTVRLFLDRDSVLELSALPEAGVNAVLGRGSALLRLRGAAAEGERAEIVTPLATILAERDGRVLIELDREGGRISVLEGAAQVVGPEGRVDLRAGEALRLNEGGGSRRERAGSGSALVAWATAGEPRRSVPASARGMTGAEDLASYGNWETNAEYGDVWLPRSVQANYVPFSDGSWEWRDPWGWTWVDAAPWAFATAHYGRWVRVGPRWGWAPAPYRGPRLRPVYAPAVVAFFGGISIGIGTARPYGWVPLGAREPWYPWYRASPGYVARLNLRAVPNVVIVRNNWINQVRIIDRDGGRDGAFAIRGAALPNFTHRRAATVVPAAVFLNSRPVRGDARRPDAVTLARTEPLDGPPRRPTEDTRGVTPRVAERLGLDLDRDRDQAGGRDAAAAERAPREERDARAPREEPGSGERRGGDAAGAAGAAAAGVGAAAALRAGREAPERTEALRRAREAAATRPEPAATQGAESRGTAARRAPEATPGTAERTAREAEPRRNTVDPAAAAQQRRDAEARQQGAEQQRRQSEAQQQQRAADQQRRQSEAQQQGAEQQRRQSEAQQQQRAADQQRRAAEGQQQQQADQQRRQAEQQQQRAQQQQADQQRRQAEQQQQRAQQQQADQQRRQAEQQQQRAQQQQAEQQQRQAEQQQQRARQQQAEQQQRAQQQEQQRAQQQQADQQRRQAEQQQQRAQQQQAEQQQRAQQQQQQRAQQQQAEQQQRAQQQEQQRAQQQQAEQQQRAQRQSEAQQQRQQERQERQR